jgi:hypothetical protein
MHFSRLSISSIRAPYLFWFWIPAPCFCFVSRCAAPICFGSGPRAFVSRPQFFISMGAGPRTGPVLLDRGPKFLFLWTRAPVRFFIRTRAGGKGTRRRSTGRPYGIVPLGPRVTRRPDSGPANNKAPTSKMWAPAPNRRPTRRHKKKPFTSLTPPQNPKTLKP